MMKKKLGLIGKNISYSSSKKYFEEKFRLENLPEFSYDLFDIPEIEQVEKIFACPNLVGLNVTIPYKQLILPYLDEMSNEVEKIGAVNTVLIKNGKKTGFNTDVDGFRATLNQSRKPHQNSALILGNGGAAQAVKFVLDNLNIPYKTVFRNSEMNFDSLSSAMIQQHKIIIQTTPVGTFPNVESVLPFDFEALSPEHLVIDLIYNPSKTKFLQLAEKQGAEVVNGELMLKMQAEKAWEIWNQF